METYEADKVSDVNHPTYRHSTAVYLNIGDQGAQRGTCRCKLAARCSCGSVNLPFSLRNRSPNPSEPDIRAGPGIWRPHSGDEHVPHSAGCRRAGAGELA
jgi:hypothetical protein